ncbi:MAG TPA: folylpolyglutamate synthase/dihydrofolate synthase family protein [Spirochaetota bacterium]|nr:folylpolyglutamate synthase/dihydrofolate synthase family protein [Spirochaetota bacterium]HPI89167.1 folylpolyglutamate synthase/dihydrofolate synthase family protein [Spirochaetota bacterium]HPR46838.1 folylpolyglutamate synthase/dihydrofolate synthase family protein [Spirochaetota bacterium]
MAEKIDILEKYINNERRVDYTRYDPENICRLLKALGNPHEHLHGIHIAGTNGKGSVAHMLDRMARESGYTCGLYTSPHLREVNERIAVNGIAIPDHDLAEILARIDTMAENNSLEPTYFDVLTAAAFCHFADRHCDIVIIETGLGGRMDSTSVFWPLCSVITEISMDHAHILGDTIEKIAAEKAGIIKSAVPVIAACSDPVATGVIEESAAIKNAPCMIMNRDFRVTRCARTGSGYSFDLDMSNDRFIHGAEIRLNGRHQVNNAAAAAAAMAVLRKKFPRITDESIRRGLENTVVPGRMETISASPLVMYDPAHNVAAVESLIRTIADEFKGHTPVYIVSLMKDKDVHGILDLLSGRGIACVYYNLADPRAKIFSPGESPAIAAVYDNIRDLAGFINSPADRRHIYIFCGSFRLYPVACSWKGTSPANKENSLNQPDSGEIP